MNRVFLNADEHERGRFMHTAIKSMPWLICASAAWLTLVPCGMAFAESYPPLDNNNTKYSIKGEEAGKTISGGNLSLSSVTDNIWYVIANWAQAGNAIKGTTTLLKNFVLGNNTVLANGSAPEGTELAVCIRESDNVIGNVFSRKEMEDTYSVGWNFNKNVSFHSKCKVWGQRTDTVQQFKEPGQRSVPRIF